MKQKSGRQPFTQTIIMEINSSNLILYGGYEGPAEEICEYKRSLGEFLLDRFDQIGSKIVLVSVVLKIEMLFSRSAH